MAHSEQRNERNRVQSKFCRGWWSAVWEDGKLRIKRQLTAPAGTAFGAPESGGTLGEPIVEYDGEAITATGMSDLLFDETVDIIVQLVKLLKERDRESGWAWVAVSGDSEMARKLQSRLRADRDAPAIFEPLV